MKIATLRDTLRTRKKVNPDCSKCHHFTGNCFCTVRVKFYIANPKFCYFFNEKNKHLNTLQSERN